MVKKTFKELQELDVLVGALYKRNTELQKGKFGYAYKRFVDTNYVKILKEYQHKINDARIDFALEDPITKEILKDKEDSRGFKYSKDGLKKVILKENEITDEFNPKEVEIDPYFISEASLPELSDEEREQLIGVLIKK